MHVSPKFKLVFVAVLVLTGAAAIAQTILAASWLEPTANQQSVFDSLGFTWRAGIGAIFGLLGGKTLD